MKALQVFYCGACGVANEDWYWVVCKCRDSEAPRTRARCGPPSAAAAGSGWASHRMSIRTEDAGQVRAALRRGGRVRVGQLEMGRLT